MKIRLSFPSCIIQEWYQLLGAKTLHHYQCKDSNGYDVSIIAGFSEHCLSLTITSDTHELGSESIIRVTDHASFARTSTNHNGRTSSTTTLRELESENFSPTLASIPPSLEQVLGDKSSNSRIIDSHNTDTILNILSSEPEQFSVLQVEGEQMSVLIPCEPVLCDTDLEVNQQVTEPCEGLDSCAFPVENRYSLNNKILKLSSSNILDDKVTLIQTDISTSLSESVGQELNRLKSCMNKNTSADAASGQKEPAAKKPSDDSPTPSGSALVEGRLQNSQEISRITDKEELIQGITKFSSIDQDKYDVCKYCGKSIKSKGHSQTCKDNPERVNYFYCTCNFRSTNIHVVNDHKITCKKKYSKLNCKECGKEFQSRGGLSQHMRSIHRVAKNTSRPVEEFSCDICGKAGFIRKSLLDRHKNKHSDAKPFVCETCGTSFKKLHHLRQHVNSIHKNIYPYHCKKCGHGVKNRSGLETHGCTRIRRKQITEQELSSSPVLDINDDSYTTI